MSRKEYRALFFSRTGTKVRKYRKVTNVVRLGAWLKKNGFDWKYCNVYDQKTEQYCERVYNNA